jgi:hypothetical protein
MYFVLACPPLVNEKGEALMEIHNCIEVGNVWDWCDGKKLEPKEEDVPIPININFEPFRGYTGPPRELCDVGVPIMSKRLADALAEVGVDNLQLFPVALRNTVTGQVYDYRAFKVVGLVAAADLSASKSTVHDNKPVADVSFESLVIDETKTHSLLLFRLAENINALMVHDKVRKHILSKGIDTLTFIKPEDYVQV